MEIMDTGTVSITLVNYTTKFIIMSYYLLNKLIIGKNDVHVTVWIRVSNSGSNLGLKIGLKFDLKFIL